MAVCHATDLGSINKKHVSGISSLWLGLIGMGLRPKRLSNGAGWTHSGCINETYLENMFTNNAKQRCWRLVPDLFCRGAASGAKRAKLTAKRP
jgi:hypothetical protein